jgi:hypothetical protein
MKKFICLFLFLPFVAFTQERITLVGNVFDGVTFFPIKDANIYNFNTKKYCFTNKDGIFNILVSKGDTLVISKPIYKQILLEISQEIMDKKMIDISVYYKVITLKEVNVYALPPTYEVFKKDFTNTNLSDYFVRIEGTAISKEERQQYSTGTGNLLGLIPGKVGQAVSHPISFLYETFSRKAKMGRLYQELVDNQEEVDRLPLKYNRDLVSSLTGLEGNALLDFMTYCKFSYYDLIRWTPEFIIAQIQKRFNEYEFYKALEGN